MDDETLELFVRRLAKTKPMNSRDAGYVITEYWKDEAEEWVKHLDAVKPTQDPGEFSVIT